MAEKVYVLCATDENYAPYCGVMLTSVFENTPNAEAFILVSNQLSSKQTQKFSQLELEYNTKITFIQLDEANFSQLSVGLGNWSVEAYYRLAAPQILPNLDKIIYLDCDVVVCCDLRELWDIPIYNNSALVALDPLTYEKSTFERLKYPFEKGYFNSGVMVINLEYWRKNDVQQQSICYLKENAANILYIDQDALNYVLQDSKKNIPFVYNFIPFSFCDYIYSILPDDIKKELECIEPKIIHYAGGYRIARPWSCCSYRTPFRNKWYSYKNKSPWKDLREKYPQQKKLKWWIKRWFLMPLGFYLNQNVLPRFCKKYS